MWPPKVANEHFDRVPEKSVVNKGTGTRGRGPEALAFELLAPVHIQTANGVKEVSKAIKLNVERLQKEAPAIIIGDCPRVLSCGELCMDDE